MNALRTLALIAVALVVTAAVFELVNAGYTAVAVLLVLAAAVGVGLVRQALDRG